MGSAFAAVFRPGPGAFLLKRAGLPAEPALGAAAAAHVGQSHWPAGMLARVMPTHWQWYHPTRHLGESHSIISPKATWRRGEGMRDTMAGAGDTPRSGAPAHLVA